MVKRLSIIFRSIIVILVVATVLVGNYFVNYALVADGSGDDREPNEEVADEIDIEDLEIIAQTRESQEMRGQSWFVETDNEEVSITTADGYELYGHTYTHDEVDEWVFIVHGYKANEMNSITMAPYFYEAGYNVLTYDLRAHGESEGDFIGMGYLDGDDLIVWTDYIIENYDDAKVVYHGTSMGAATVMNAVGDEALPDEVKGFVIDAGFSSIWGIYESELSHRFGLPTFPVLDMADLMARIRAGYSFKNDGITVESVSESKIPMLLIHGENDDFVPVDMAYEIFDAKSEGEKQIEIFEGAGHSESKYIDEERYYEVVFEFLDNVY
mgnify:CR=1 FL=1